LARKNRWKTLVPGLSELLGFRFLNTISTSRGPQSERSLFFRLFLTLNRTTIMASPTPITVAHGDGIGPEIMAATLKIIQEAGASLDIQTIEIGEKQYLKGNLSGMEPSAFESLRDVRTRKIFMQGSSTGRPLTLCNASS